MSLARGDRVITPTGEEAVVERYRPDGRVDVRYVGALNPEHAEVALPDTLLRRIHRDQPRPRPVRIREDRDG